jgi:hypothetical protein
MTSRQTLVNQRFYGTLAQKNYFYSSRARIKVQEENARAQNENRSFSQVDLGFLAQVG